MAGLKWSEGVEYHLGDTIKFKGRKYKLLQGHTSQSDWTPDVVPALWQHMGDGSDRGSEDEMKDRKQQRSRSHDRRHGSEQRELYEDAEKGGIRLSFSKNPLGVRNLGETRNHSNEEHKAKDKRHKGNSRGDRSEGESSEDGKKLRDEVNIEGHSGKKEKRYREEEASDRDEDDTDFKKSNHHETEEGHSEHKRTLDMSGHAEVGKTPRGGQTVVKPSGAFTSSQAWINAARKTTSEFNQSGPKGPTTWILVEGNNISEDAIKAGENKNGSPLYVARAYYEGGLHIGRASRNGAFIGYGGREIPITQYEVLLGDSHAITWVPSSAGPTGVRPVEGGSDRNGKQLLIAQTMYDGEVIPGKATDWISGALIAVGGQEVSVREYNILAYA